MRSARLATEYSGLRYWMGTAPRHLVHRRSCFLNISPKTASNFEPVGAHPVVYSNQSTLLERRSPFFFKCLQRGEVSSRFRGQYGTFPKVTVTCVKRTRLKRPRLHRKDNPTAVERNENTITKPRRIQRERLVENRTCFYHVGSMPEAKKPQSTLQPTRMSPPKPSRFSHAAPHPATRRPWDLQERRAIRENPAVIPKIGAFFVHDDRSGGASGRKSAGGGNQQQQKGRGGDGAEESPEEEEVGLGRWRADALPSAKKKAGGEQR